MCFHTDRVNARVWADSAGHFLNLLYDIVDFFVINSFGVCLAGKRQTLWESIDSDHPTSPQQPRATNGELPYWTAAPHSDHISVFEIAIFRGHIPRREDIRKKQNFFIGRRS